MSVPYRAAPRGEAQLRFRVARQNQGGDGLGVQPTLHGSGGKTFQVLGHELDPNMPVKSARGVELVDRDCGPLCDGGVLFGEQT